MKTYKIKAAVFAGSRYIGEIRANTATELHRRAERLARQYYATEYRLEIAIFPTTGGDAA